MVLLMSQLLENGLGGFLTRTRALRSMLAEVRIVERTVDQRA